MPQQLTFDLPATVRQGPDDFFVSPANETAYAMVRTPEAWPDGKLALVGPAGSGKTHLARLFAASSGALMLDAKAIDPNAALPTTALVLENGDSLPPAAEEWLFHAHNHMRAEGLPLLLTGHTAPARWTIALPDLASRLSATSTVTINEPDDPLLLAILLKHFADRQLSPAPDAITYLTNHLARSFEAIRTAVQRLDQAALAERKPLTRPFVIRVLDSFTEDGE